jgi:predicted dehydrogenase
MSDYRFAIIDPGHFHAALVQKQMYPAVDSRVHVYAPLGPDLLDYLARISRFNRRSPDPTSWELDIHASSDFLTRMAKDRAGNIAVFSGRNRGKIEKILAALEAGFHVLADKPWIIRTEDMPLLSRALELAAAKGLVAYDIMTERFEITSILQRELVNSPGIFGSPVPGSPDEPSVYMESVHHIYKLVAGVPNPRPAWFFDTLEQGEALADVGTHLVDLAQWTLFPDAPIDTADVKLHGARRWPTAVPPAQFQAVTGEARAETLDYYCNTAVQYEIRGIHVKLDVLWNWEAPQGAGDTHLAVYRGTRGRVEVRQGAEEKFRPELYIVPVDATARAAAQARVAELLAKYPGIGCEERGDRLLVTIPDSYRVGHEAHFAQVTGQFLRYLANPALLPAWENPYMIAKYFVSTAGTWVSQGRPAR